MGSTVASARPYGHLAWMPPAKVAARAGTVWINSGGMVNPLIPFGGAKQCGHGLEFGGEVLKALAVPQVIFTPMPGRGMRYIGRILALPAQPPDLLTDDPVPVEDGHRRGHDPDPQQLPGVGAGH